MRGAHSSMSSRIGWVCRIAVLAVTIASQQAKSAESRSDRSFETMTVNLYVGGGTGRVLALDPTAPGYITNLIATVTGI